MPVIVTKDNTEYSLVPAPLVSFSKQTYNNVGRPGFGADYTVSLQGTLVQTHGNPYYSTGSGNASLSEDVWTLTSEVEPEEIAEVSGIDRLNATIRKQELIRSLFTNPMISGTAQPIKIQIKGWNESDSDPGSGIYFYGFVDDISFDSDGRWANPGSYNINLRTSSFLSSANDSFPDNYNENNPSGYAISSLTENFDIQEDGRRTMTWNTAEISSKKYTLDYTDKVYSINRSITAVGSPVYDETGGYRNGFAPWQQASGFVHDYLDIGSGVLNSFPDLKTNAISKSGYNVSNFVYQESIDKEAGTYSINETFILYSGISPVLENVTINHDVGENGSNTITVQGNIEGLNTSGGFESSLNHYNNAYSYWTGVIDTGIPSQAYFYARGALTGIQWLHPQHLSKSVASDFSAGTISYNYSFDDRPPNIVPGSISESIQVNDTYPGEIFSVTPVIGRSQPVLQYLNSRSEYKRSLSINVTMGPNYGSGSGNSVDEDDIDSNGVLYTGIRNSLQKMYLNHKPSVSLAEKTALNEIFQAMNPVNDPNFTVANGKCFHSAPTESWDARTRNYTYNVEWTYERTPNE